VAVGNFLGTCLALRLVDRLGRRRLLLGATAAASVALSMLAVSLGQIRMKDVVDGQGDGPAGEQAGAWAYVSLVMVSSGQGRRCCGCTADSVHADDRLHLQLCTRPGHHPGVCWAQRDSGHRVLTLSAVARAV
jgi:hypothetical protein